MLLLLFSTLLKVLCVRCVAALLGPDLAFPGLWSGGLLCVISLWRRSPWHEWVTSIFGKHRHGFHDGSKSKVQSLFNMCDFY